MAPENDTHSATTPKNVETANPESLISKVDQTIETNLDSADAVKSTPERPEPQQSTPESPKVKAAEDRPAWHSEPLSNFETDSAGKVKLDDAGNPVRRGGRPRKTRNLKVGEKLASGGVYKGRAEAVTPSRPRPFSGVRSNIQTPNDADSVGSGSAATASDDQASAVAEPGQSDEFGDDAGTVVMEGVMNLVTAKHPKAKPTPNEHESLQRHASKWLGRIKLPAWAAFSIVMLCYLVRIKTTTTATPAAVKNERDSDAHSGGGDDSIGQNLADTGNHARDAWSQALFGVRSDD